MNNTQLLLERVRERVHRKSKNAVAAAINADEANVRRYFKGKGFPNAMHCTKIAEILGLDARDVVLYVQEDKTKNEEDREYLRCKLPRLQPTVAIAAALLVGGLFTTNQGRAAAQEQGWGSLNHVNFSSHNYVYYVL